LSCSHVEAHLDESGGKTSLLELRVGDDVKESWVTKVRTND